MWLLKKFNKYTNSIITNIMAIAFILMTISTFFQVIFRYVVQSSLSFSQELARYLFIWVIFLGAVSALREDSHIQVNMFVDLIKNNKIRKYVKIFSKLLSVLFCVVLMVFGYQTATRILGFGQTSPTMPFIQIGYIYAIIPIGSFFMITNLIEKIIEKKNDSEGGFD